MNMHNNYVIKAGLKVMSAVILTSVVTPNFVYKIQGDNNTYILLHIYNTYPCNISNILSFLSGQRREIITSSYVINECD